MSNLKINMNESENVKQSLESRTLKVCVVGIGRIGLPTALSFAKSGLDTIGVDINETLVDNVNSGIFPLKDEPGYEEIFHEVINSKKFSATTKIEDAIPKSDLILLSLPTPMDENNIPDYSALTIVGKKLSSLLSPKSLVIVESTIEPGFVENELISIIEGKNDRLSVGENFGIGVCPETANPGQIMNDFNKLPRLVGAIDKKTANAITKIYGHVFTVQLIPMTDCKTANAVKLTTNVFRDINIAFVNELALLFEKLDIDVFEVLEAAKTKYNFQIHYPGAGVGGPCLPVNSYQILNSAKSVGMNDFKIVKAARQINEKMPLHVVELLLDGFKQVKKDIVNSKILILGITYKPDVKDIQLSPVEDIIKKLLELNADVKIYDPYFKSETVFGIKTENDFVKAIDDVDAIILATAHQEFHDLEPAFLAPRMKTPIVIDTRGVMDPYLSKKAGLIFRGLGRGKF